MNHLQELRHTLKTLKITKQTNILSTSASSLFLVGYFIGLFSGPEYEGNILLRNVTFLRITQHYNPKDGSLESYNYTILTNKLYTRCHNHCWGKVFAVCYPKWILPSFPCNKFRSSNESASRNVADIYVRLFLKRSGTINATYS
jgi:hypothetical protein